MSRPPSIPSHPGPPPSYTPYSSTHASSSRPELMTSGHRSRSRDTSGYQHSPQQLPSLRTLLEPELLDKKSLNAPQRTIGTLGAHGLPSRYGSSSPTLKRRHEADWHSRAYPQHNAIISQTPYFQHPPPSISHTDSQSTTSSTSGSAFHPSRYESQRHDSYVQPSHGDPSGTNYRLSLSTADSLGSITNHAAQDELGDMDRPVRRRLDGSRAPLRASRCVGQRDMPGEGVCYVYEDGTYCRAIIDGEPVNPSWGITKAGKPRKRLAQACLTCREKKIKCEPGVPKCHQCAKSQRVCRGSQNQAGMDTASGETSPSNSTPVYKNPSLEGPSPVATTHRNKAPGEPRDSSTKFDIWNLGAPFRPRTVRPNLNAGSRDMSVHSIDSDWSGSMTEQGFDDPRRASHQDRLAIQWEQDPFETDPRLTMHLLDIYFLHAGRATYGVFPRRPFLAWVESNRDKSPDSLMLLYSILATGSLYSNDPDKRVLGKRFAYVASYAAEKRFGKFSLQLCQTRLLLALYNFARGKSQEAWDFCGAGVHAISALRLNSEEGVRDLSESIQDSIFDFDHLTFEECCRRTFWSGFLMERYNGFLGGTLFVLNIEDAFVRLPCRDSMYEASTPTEAPFFDEALLSGQIPSNAPLLGDMAYSCLIAAIWGDVLTFTERAARRPDHGYELHYEQFYTRAYEKLAIWRSILPANLRYSSQNLDASTIEGNAGAFISIHTLHYAALIRLNRHVRTHALPTDKVRRNIEEAIRNSSSVLAMMHSLATISRQRRLAIGTSSEFPYSTPFPGHALLQSIDVLTSAGTFATLPDLLASIAVTISCMDELVDFWTSARSQQNMVTERLKQLTEVAGQDQRGVRNGSHGSYWKLDRSLESTFGNDDVLYKSDDQLLFDVVGQLSGH
ncbi:hypothetical protein T440DRAFT_393811 [Plenodomus tracheiphilus IPT5]|uniref:Zn(2)-C6 fungal-type domain-containing protein n=1 Tax=Plenodomus tracheiphilus IPT5 TaxID=1408161 RepID=A0A6A7B951_9PLEO|nr:hypothetical protein T440DRAFT_393811 [Plenodomus tracheiphilus IPT5]